MKKLALAALLLLASTPAWAVVTNKTALSNAGWTDLGAGPALLSFKGGAVFVVADTTPSTIPIGEGFQILSGSSFRVDSASHIWGSASGGSAASAYFSAY